MTSQNYPIADNSRLNDTDAKLMVIDKKHSINHHLLKDLDLVLKKGDVVVVNNTGTLPASFHGIHQETGEKIELRLAFSMSSNPKDLSQWTALIFGEGDWQIPTEDRKKPPHLQIGDKFVFNHDLIAEILDFSPINFRLIEIKFLGLKDDLWDKIYQIGRPIQYSYLKNKLNLWDQQTIFSGSPVSVESPSASFQLSWDLIFKFEKKGIEIVTIAHAISLSSIGDEVLDKVLPLPERYWISQPTADIINKAIIENRRIIAFGTSITRALESNAFVNNRKIQPGSFQTTLRITVKTPLHIVDGLLTGMHMTGESHLDLLESFLPSDKLQMAYDQALEHDYLWHEYGDLSLILLTE